MPGRRRCPRSAKDSKSKVPVRSSGFPVKTFEAIWGPSADLIWAVGDNAIVRYDGTVWTEEVLPVDPPGTPEDNQGFRAKAVWGADASNVWAVGDRGKIAYSDGSGLWTFQDSQWYGGTPFTAVWGFSATDVFTLGAVGKVRRWDGAEWTVVEVKTPKKTPLGDQWPADQVVPPEGPGLTYVGAYGVDPEHIWFFTSEGLLIRYGDEYEL